MKKFNYAGALKKVGVSYLGSVNQSAKLVLNGTKQVYTYGLYLAPWTLAATDGLPINTCPGGKYCHALCLNGSGHNKLEKLSGRSTIEQARIKKTRLFYQDRELFMRILVHEIRMWKRRAEAKGYGFSVRLNCTSDLSPKLFRLDGQNILDIFPDIQFYDYTKVQGRLGMVREYKNYDLTFSFDGHNWAACEQFLNRGINVAVVFESAKRPKQFKSFDVISMVDTDLRYLDAKGERGYVGYLEYHKTASNYENGVYHAPNDPFVIREDNPAVIY